LTWLYPTLKSSPRSPIQYEKAAFIVTYRAGTAGLRSNQIYTCIVRSACSAVKLAHCLAMVVAEPIIGVYQ
jgi:hypothetical protein